MLTRCPTCRTTFRVTAEQLMARRGRVRCGHCQGVFNALETLIEETPAPAAPAAKPVVVPPAHPVAPPATVAVAETPAPAEPAVAPPPSPAELPPPAAEESVIIQGFDVDQVGGPLPEPPAASEDPPFMPPASHETAPAMMGEEVVEPVIEYVELGGIDEEEDAATEVLISPDRILDDALAQTEVNIEGFTAPSVDEAIAAEEADAPAQDPYTKTVVGFTWYVEPEPPVGEGQPAEDFTKTVVQSLRMIEPELPSEPDEPSFDQQFARTVIAPWQTEPPEPAPMPRAAETPSAVQPIRPQETSPAADDDAFAKTVVQSVRMFDTEFAPEPVMPVEAASDDETQTIPFPVGEDEIETLTDDQPPASAFAAPPAQSAATPAPSAPPVDTVRAAAAPATRRDEPVAAAPAAAEAEDDFAKTVVQSIRMFEPEPEPEPDEEMLFDEFEVTSIEPRHIETAKPGSATPAPSAPEAALRSGHAAAAEEFETDSTDLKLAIAREFARTVHDTAMAKSKPGQLDFEIGPIDDIHVEKEEESPSIVDLSVRPPTAFPTLETPTHADPEATAAAANAILNQLKAATPSEAPVVHAPAVEVAGLPIDEIERTAVRVALATPPGEPVVDNEDEPAATAEAEPIAELQELPRRRRWPWVLGSVIALLLLALQAIIHFRVELSVRMPGAKPALVAMCQLLDCKLPLPSQIELIGIETSDLSPSAEGAGHLQLAATLRNRAAFGQAWPDLELTLTDAADKALVRRTLGPSDYLPPTVKAADGFPAKSEQPLHLDLKAPGVPAVGYRLYVFYP